MFCNDTTKFFKHFLPRKCILLTSFIITTTSRNDRHKLLSDITTKSRNDRHKLLYDITMTSRNDRHKQLSDITTTSRNDRHKQLSDITTTSRNDRLKQLSDITTMSRNDRHKQLSDISKQQYSIFLIIKFSKKIDYFNQNIKTNYFLCHALKIRRLD